MIPIVMGVLGFWNRVPGPVRKVAIYATIAGLGLWAFRVFWLNPHDNRIEANARIKVTRELEKEFDTRYKKQIHSLQKEKAEIEETAARLQEANEALARSRESIVNSLNRSLANIKIIGANQHAQDQSVPDYMLDGRLRDVSNALECAKPGTTRPGCPGAADGN
jgi:hypothetical protein